MAVKSPRYWKTAANQTVTWTYIFDHPDSRRGDYGFIECTGCGQAEGGDPGQKFDTGDAARHAAVCREVQIKIGGSTMANTPPAPRPPADDRKPPPAVPNPRPGGK